MIIYSVIIGILILAVIPAGLGMLIVSPFKDRSVASSLIFGYPVMMLSFEIVTIPILLLSGYGNFRYVIWIYTPVMLILFGLGIFRGYKTGFIHETAENIRSLSLRNIPAERLIVWAIAFAILIVMFVFAERFVIFDGDDAYYVVQSLIAQQKGTMYASSPYTGRAASIDMRHALAVFTMWIAYAAGVSKVHATVFCHSVLPLVIIPLSILVYSGIGSRLLGKKKDDLLPYFVIFIELFILFGRVSLYTPEAFLLARSWQGKAVAANVLLPLVILAFSYLYEESADVKVSPKVWIMLAVLNASAGIFSSLAVVLVSLLIGASGLVLTIIRRKAKILIGCLLCCVPGMLYMLLYLYYTYFGWR